MSNGIRRAVQYESISRNEFHRHPLPMLYVNNELREMPGNGFLTPPKQFSTDTWRRSYDDLTLSRKDLERPATAIDLVDPEINDLSVSNGSYHVRLNLKANLLNPHVRPSSALPATSMTSDFVDSSYSSFQRGVQDYNLRQYGRPASVANHLMTGYNSGSLTNHDLSIYNANNVITSDLLSHAPVNARTSTATLPIISTQRNANSKAVVNIDATKNVTVRPSNVQDDEFIIKSIKSTEKSTATNSYVDDDVNLDLRLFAKTKVTESDPIVESETIKVDSSRKQSAPKRSRRTLRPLDNDNRDRTDSYNTRTTGRTLQREINSESNLVKMEKVNATSEAIDKQTIQKSCNTDPELTSTAVQTLCVSDSAVQTDFVPEPPPVIIQETVNEQSRYGLRSVDDDYQDHIPRPKITNQTTRQVHTSHAYDVPDYEDESQYVKTSGFIRRLMEGAPQGSLQQKMDVRKEDDQIVGPLPKEEIERMYTNSMINVDSVSEKVDLTLASGIAQLVVKITYERIVPIQDSQDTFKKSAVVVTKVIDVDLTVTEARKKIYDDIIESHKNGRLDNKHTFELYKAFIALAEADEGLGMNQEHFSIEKKVDEEKLWNLNNNLSEASEQQLNLNILENKLSDFSKQTTMTYRPSTSSETRRSVNQWESNDTGYTEPSFTFDWRNTGTHSAQEISTDSFEYNTKSTIGSTAAYNKMMAEDFYKEKSAANWKSIFNNWTDGVVKESQKLLGRSGQVRLGPRINVHEYLRPGGNRTHNLVMDPLHKSINLKSTTTFEGEHDENFKASVDSLSNKVLHDAGLQPGGHRQRMNSYVQTSSEKTVAADETFKGRPIFTY